MRVIIFNLRWITTHNWFKEEVISLMDRSQLHDASGNPLERNILMSVTFSAIPHGDTPCQAPRESLGLHLWRVTPDGREGHLP